ncbi:MAG: hypothetical protein IPJ17_01770 [Holophagales bacterium]|jgi:DNA-directed RNA polymerase specialized sigma24 family protein|nr:MAG: hypothetical protein IPJ17_01770 [Holophagales bacterium]
MEPLAATSPRPPLVDRALVEVALALARRLSRHEQDVEDLAQEALLRLLRYDGEIASPTAWLYMMIRGLALRPRRQVEEPLPALVPAVDPWPLVEHRLDARGRPARRRHVR